MTVISDSSDSIINASPSLSSKDVPPIDLMVTVTYVSMATTKILMELALKILKPIINSAVSKKTQLASVKNVLQGFILKKTNAIETYSMDV
jgi:hypothetical protein